MKLKKYLQFIKESIDNQNKIWLLSENDIREYLYDITDAGYIVDIEFGFSTKQRHYNYGTSKYVEKEVFDRKALGGDDVKPAYFIRIINNTQLTDEDVTDTLRFTMDMISSQSNCTVELYDESSKLDIDSIQIKGGVFIDDNSEAEGYIAIFAIQNEEVEISISDLVKYYNWEVSLYKNDIPYVEIELEDMADYMLSRRSEYKNFLVKGEEIMWDYYDLSDYYPDLDSLFRYELSKENQNLLIKCLIKDFGGFEKFRTLIAKYSEVSDLDKFENEDILVDFLITERFNRIIINIIKGEFEMSEEPLSEISDTIANWRGSAHVFDNYKEIIDEFDEIVGDEMPFTKVEREITKHYTTKDGERREYKTDVTYFQIPYDNKWIEDVDPDYLFNKKLESVFREWIGEQDFRYEMNPRISDYGDVDTKKMNEEITNYLKRYLNKSS